MQQEKTPHSPAQAHLETRQNKGVSLESPQSAQIAQLAAMVDASPAMTAQRKLTGMIHSSPVMVAQRKAIDGIHANLPVQREEAEQEEPAATQRAEAPAKPNHTGLPDNLKTGIESLSGLSMDNVLVHYNSSQPAQLNALAFAQGTDIHVAPGQEQHLPHEAWHVVQQAQGRVKPTMQMKDGVPVNDDAGLECEADVMGTKAEGAGEGQQSCIVPISAQVKAVQLYSYGEGGGGVGRTRTVTVTGNSKTKKFEECTYNSVEFLAGEKQPTTGTPTSTPAAWAGWLTNKKGGNNATQLHVVNKRWGGLGGQTDKNIVPGTPAENSHHLHEAEKKFDECFDGAGKAKNNCKYECWAVPKYGTSVDVKGGNADYGDPTISAQITDNGVTTPYAVTDGSDGLTFKEGG
jgi:hypothetical protein